MPGHKPPAGRGGFGLVVVVFVLAGFDFRGHDESSAYDGLDPHHVAWLAVDRLKPIDLTETWQKTGAYLLMLHGGVAMLMLLLLGAVIPIHVAVAWRRGKNRVTGSMMLASNALLIVTAFALYYSGSETWRHQASLLHIGFGLGLPVLWALHVWRGKRTVQGLPRSVLSK